MANKKVKLAHNPCESPSKATFEKLKKEFIQEAKEHSILSGDEIFVILRDPKFTAKEYFISIDPKGNVRETVKNITSDD